MIYHAEKEYLTKQQIQSLSPGVKVVLEFDYGYCKSTYYGLVFDNSNSIVVDHEISSKGVHACSTLYYDRINSEGVYDSKKIPSIRFQMDTSGLTRFYSYP